jgi:predicted RNA-binding Zn ribbon-like protein
MPKGYTKQWHGRTFNRCGRLNWLMGRDVAKPLHQPKSLGGRLAVDFVNLGRVFSGVAPRPLTWELLITFLEAASVVSPQRGSQLLSLPQVDSRSAEALLSRSARLQATLRDAFSASVRKTRIGRESVEPLNEILRITEGHDELVSEDGAWRLEFIAREDSLDWLLAAIARSGAEILAEGADSRLCLCANPGCGLFFCDTSRTRKRRWCSMSTCGNRHKVAAFAQRHAQK